MIRILNCADLSRSEILRREIPQAAVSDKVTEIIQCVRSRGDEALRDYNRNLYGAETKELLVNDEEIDNAERKLSPEFLQTLRDAAENIRSFHACQVRSGFTLSQKAGIVMGQRILPMERVGITVPGGAAPLSSTVLMNAIPAKLAGCGEIIMVTPPEKDGSIAPSVLAAARIAGVDKIFRIGGAQGIAALAYGTESVPRVDKIVGPGGAFVSEAKKQVFGQVAIDMVAGPSEILVVADAMSDAENVAADMLSQAEHDKNASAVLVTDSADLAERVRDEIERQLPLLPREEIARASIEGNGKIIVAQDLSEAVDIANEIAPEHLELCVEAPFDWLGKIRCAGSVFLGRDCPEAVGDYFAGVNHTLPTSGTARFSSPLSVDDFVRKMQFTYYSHDALAAQADSIACFAEEEKLRGHARSVLVRKEKSR